MTKIETIIKCGLDGGSWTLVGVKGANGWRFRTTRNEMAIYDLLDEEDREEANRAGFEPWEESDWVVSWEAALALFDEYPWHLFYPLRVHPDLAGRIWVAANKRFRRGRRDRFFQRLLHPKRWRLFRPDGGDGDWARDNHENWHRLCRGGGRVSAYSDFE